MTALADQAVQYGYAAWAAAPDDGRLLQNLRVYVAAQGVPTYACIPAVEGERLGETAVLVEQLEAQGVVPIVDWSTAPIHDKWHAGLDQAAELANADRWTVYILNNDLRVSPDFATILGAALRSADDVGMSHPRQPDGTFTGWAMCLRGEQGYRPDRDFEWFFGDNDLCKQIEKDGRRVLSAPVACEHLYPSQSTIASPERIEMARRDQDRFAAKWPDVDSATLLFNRLPNWPHG